MGGMIAQEFALRHADRLDRLVLTGTGAAPARSAVDPIRIWSWVKANDPAGEVFGGQQFASLFSTAFLRNHEAVQETAALLASNPYPMSPEAYGDRPMPTRSSMPSTGLARSPPRPWSSWESRIC